MEQLSVSFRKFQNILLSDSTLVSTDSLANIQEEITHVMQDQKLTGEELVELRECQTLSIDTRILAAIENAKALSCHGDFSEALSALQQFNEPLSSDDVHQEFSVALATTKLIVLVKLNDFDGALRVAQDLKSKPYVDKDVKLIIIIVFILHGLVSDARELLTEYEMDPYSSSISMKAAHVRKILEAHRPETPRYPPPPPPATHEQLETKYFPLQNLLYPGPYPEHVDPHSREEYLDDDEFKSVFHMNKHTFAELPKWRQIRLKKDAKLF